MTCPRDGANVLSHRTSDSSRLGTSCQAGPVGDITHCVSGRIRVRWVPSQLGAIPTIRLGAGVWLVTEGDRVPIHSLSAAGCR